MFFTSSCLAVCQPLWRHLSIHSVIAGRERGEKGKREERGERSERRKREREGGGREEERRGEKTREEERRGEWEMVAKLRVSVSDF